jgi:hypothetical protein
VESVESISNYSSEQSTKLSGKMQGLQEALFRHIQAFLPLLVSQIEGQLTEP